MDLFSKYVEHFFDKKKNSIGPTRFISKMHLNQLYGYFGRKLELIETVNVLNDDIAGYAATKIIKSIIKINDRISTLLLHSNINSELITELNVKLDLKISNKFKQVKNNVAIAAAVTSYARIHLIPFKLHPGCVYTDTDSAFIEGVLPDHLIGKGLGFMKDELDGNIITEGYVLGIKQYGYKYIYKISQTVVERSTFAGVLKNTLSFDDIIKLSKGDKIIREIPIRFFKSLKYLTINIKPTKITIQIKPEKLLVNNMYLPINIFNINNPLDTRSVFAKYLNKVKLYFKYLLR